MHSDTFQLKKSWGNIERNKSENDDNICFLKKLLMKMIK